MTQPKTPSIPRRVLRALANNRLAQFLIIGGALFAVAPAAESPRSIRIDDKAIAALQAAEARRIGAPVLTDTQARRLRASIVDDELLYREALRLGLDKSDIVVRRRLIQRARLLIEDLAGASQKPTEQQLRSWFAATRERWRSEPKLRFVHVFIRRNSKQDVASLRRAVIAHQQSSPSHGAPPLGDAFPISRNVPLSAVGQLDPIYGPEFIKAVGALKLGSWSQPIVSKLGHHLVKVLERTESRPAELDEVRQRVLLAFALERKRRAVTAFLSAARRRYDIQIPARAIRSDELAARSNPAAAPRTLALGSSVQGSGQ